MADFAAFARSHGLLLESYWATDRVQRCPTEHRPRKQNGRWWWDGKRGWVCAHDSGSELHWFDDPNAKPWTERDKAEWERKRAETRNAQEQKHALAALKAMDILKSCRATTHGYLRLKGVGDTVTLVTPTDALFVPMRGLHSNDLQGAQLIRWLPEEREWEKKMIYGTRAQGAVLRLGRQNAPETMLCEGYATGLSLEQAIKLTKLDITVLVCFSDSNLARVAPEVGGIVTVFADHDESGAGERAAIDSGRPWIMTEELGDANDYHAAKGIYALAKLVMEVRKK